MRKKIYRIDKNDDTFQLHLSAIVQEDLTKIFINMCDVFRIYVDTISFNINMIHYETVKNMMVYSDFLFDENFPVKS